MQYKIPIQIENEDVIVAGLSLRQLTIIMVWSWLAYTIFKSMETSAWPEVALIVALPFVVIGLVIALLKIAEMTFLPWLLNLIRLSLNARTRLWSQGTDGYSDIDIGHVSSTDNRQNHEANKTIETRMSERDDADLQIFKL